MFTANSDRYTVVKNGLEKPVITRYIRIHPESWYGHISMRTEFFGCRKGNEIYNLLSDKITQGTHSPIVKTDRPGYFRGNEVFSFNQT